MTESQARDALAAIDAKDAGERRAIERKQAENAVKKPKRWPKPRRNRSGACRSLPNPARQRQACET